MADRRFQFPNGLAFLPPLLACLAFGISLSSFSAVAASKETEVRFNRDIRPILSDHCFACHGFDAKKRKAGLRLDTAEGATAPDKDGKRAIVPGHLEQSELWRRVTTTSAEDVMPPPESHKPLKPEQLAILKRWIESGANYQKHWAFESPVKQPIPSLAGSSRARNAIDVWLLARLAKEQLSFAPEADRPTLVRRLSMDLRGLPPTTSEVDQFVNDRRVDAYEQCVDRFLASPFFGEQMATHWLDVARYADTHGMHLDNERSMWPYRDWVVRAFNRNLPFNQFTVEQLAGDLLPNPTPDQLTATGFNRCNVTTGEGGSIDAELLFRYAVDRTATTVQAWMGLTAGCAVCHDHKFDPISAREFYSMYAFFNSNADPAMDGNVLLTAPVIKLKSKKDEERLVELDREIETAEKKLQTAISQVSYTDPALSVPPPAPQKVQNVWLDDELPVGSKAVASGAPLKWVTQPEGQVFSGKRALRREDAGLAQDVFQEITGGLEIPTEGRLFAEVFIDPTHPPRTVMLQYFKDNWDHRAVWGDLDAIDWGAKNSPSRNRLGELPKKGEWIHLEFDASAVGLKSGDRITGFAVTQFGGTVFWDSVGVKGLADPSKDPSRSFVAWQKSYEGKEPSGLSEKVREVFKKSSITNRSLEQTVVLKDFFVSRILASERTRFEPLQSAVESRRKAKTDFENAIPGTFVFRDLEKPRESFVMLRGQYDKPGEKVDPGVPAVFPKLEAGGRRANRLDLARWLVSDQHPMVSRVAVNRFWQQFFGVGLVKSSDNFGSQGEVPSHPELLDWLAVVFRESGWNVKELVRLMVTSSAYRQSSRIENGLGERDPENRWLARGSRFRLDAEQIRDNALFVSGLIDLVPGGRGARTYQPPNIWEPVGYVGSNTREYKQDSGAALYRRSLYCFFKRTAPPPFMSSFDAPNREQFCTRRERSDTPLQALQLLNDVQQFEAARAFAQRMLREGGVTPEARIAFAYRTLLARSPSAEEVEIVKQALGEHLARYQRDPESARQAVSFGESKADPVLAPTELAAYALTANLLLNLDETLTRN